MGERYNDQDNSAAERGPQTPLERYHDDPRFSDEEETLLPSASDSLHVRRVGLEEPGSASSNKSWKVRLQQRIPPRLHRYWENTVIWVKGPDPPRIFSITPIFPAIQHAPLKLLDRYAPKRIHRFWLLIAFYGAWILAFVLIQWRSSFAGEIPGYGAPVRLWCGATYWSDRNGCGLNGDQCRPFANASLAFRCPANCARTQTYIPHAVGDEVIVYNSVVIGGPTNASEPISSTVYRGDSFICGAAVHAGFISDKEGGCGVLELIGEQADYPSSNNHHIQSNAFKSYFPQSFTFKEGTQTQCKDLRWPIVVVSVFATILLSLFTASPAVFFWSIFVGLFFVTALATDPPNLGDYYSLISIAVGRFLPAAFCMAVMYKFAVHRTLHGLTAQMEKTILWLGAAWVGILNNYTFDRIPIQRLTPHDLKAQPGAVPALIIVVLSIFFIALGQAWSFRVEGRMPRYLAVYGIFVATLLALLAIPRMNLRIHHYILALLLLPGTAFQNRPSLIYQGLLVGLFINGIARWGFDSLLQTPGEILRGINTGSALPVVTAPVVKALTNNITFTLGPLPFVDDHDREYDGISVLVNDVERLRTYHDFDVNNIWQNGRREWTRNRHIDGLPEYFRFAYMMGSSTADYTKAGTWTAEGEWVDMADGPSRR